MGKYLRWFLYVTVGGLMVAMFLGQLVYRVLMIFRPPKRRMCPKCGFAEVLPVGFRRARLRGKTPISYAMCRACKRRYKHWGDGPFHHVDDNEWLEIMRRPFG